jgi:hypothetical protein
MARYLPDKAARLDLKCGEALTALGYHAEAIGQSRLVLTYAGENPADEELKVLRADAYRLIAINLNATADYKGALQNIDVALSAFPHTPAYLVDRAIAEVPLGDKASAKADLQEAALNGAADDPAKKRAQAMLSTFAAQN